MQCALAKWRQCKSFPPENQPTVMNSSSQFKPERQPNHKNKGSRRFYRLQINLSSGASTGPTVQQEASKRVEVPQELLLSRFPSALQEINRRIMGQNSMWLLLSWPYMCDCEREREREFSVSESHRENRKWGLQSLTSQGTVLRLCSGEWRQRDY